MKLTKQDVIDALAAQRMSGSELMKRFECPCCEEVPHHSLKSYLRELLYEENVLGVDGDLRFYVRA